MPTIDRKSKSYKLFSSRLKAIRPYVSFDFNLNKQPTESQKRKVKRYFDEVSALRNRPNQVYRPRKPGNLKKAQKFAQHRRDLPDLKVAFIPTNGKDRVKLQFNKSGVTAKSGGISETSLHFAPLALSKDPVGYVNRKLAKSDAQQFTIQAGEYEIPFPVLKDNVAQNVLELMQQYGGEELIDDEERENNNWANWLFGVNAYHFEEQANFQEWFEEKASNIRRDKKARAAAKRKARYERTKTRTSKGKSK